MTRTQVQSLYHGLYRIYWKSGGSSLAAVGSLPSGNRWLAPTNWVGGMGTSDSKIWREVDHAEILEHDSGDGDDEEDDWDD